MDLPRWIVYATEYYRSRHSAFNTRRCSALLFDRIITVHDSHEFLITYLWKIHNTHTHTRFLFLINNAIAISDDIITNQVLVIRKISHTTISNHRQSFTWCISNGNLIELWNNTVDIAQAIKRHRKKNEIYRMIAELLGQWTTSNIYCYENM